MATVTSSISGSTITYVITDQVGNSLTITYPPAISPVSFSAGSLMQDGLHELVRLMTMIETGIRPQIIPGTMGYGN